MSQHTLKDACASQVARNTQLEAQNADLLAALKDMTGNSPPRDYGQTGDPCELCGGAALFWKKIYSPILLWTPRMVRCDSRFAPPYRNVIAEKTPHKEGCAWANALTAIAKAEETS